MGIHFEVCGKLLDLADLKTLRLLTIEDIATQLSFIKRFNRNPNALSVATHSMIVAELVPREFKLAALMHDAHEVIIGDIPTPVARLPGIGVHLAAIKRQIDAELSTVLGFELTDSSLLSHTFIKNADYKSYKMECVRLRLHGAHALADNTPVEDYLNCHKVLTNIPEVRYLLDERNPVGDFINMFWSLQNAN